MLCELWLPPPIYCDLGCPGAKSLAYEASSSEKQLSTSTKNSAPFLTGSTTISHHYPGFFSILTAGPEELSRPGVPRTGLSGQRCLWPDTPGLLVRRMVRS